MASVVDAVDAVGLAALQLVVIGEAMEDVHDVFVAERHDGEAGQPGDLVLGVAVSSVAEAMALIVQSATSQASGLILRLPIAADPLVSKAAEKYGLSLIGLPQVASWAHVIWMLRGVIDQETTPGDTGGDRTALPSDLFGLADTVAAVINAPVTIEDTQSRVLAYSSGQDRTDKARVATIVGRRVPKAVLADYRARGVFRRLVQSSEPFLVPEGPDGTLPRLVIPVHARGEWLGSIWAVVNGPVADDALGELRKAASILALHLLGLRAEAEVARRRGLERLRMSLRQFVPEAESVLHGGPWRVVALSVGDQVGDLEQQIDLWATTLRRHGWAEPLLVDLDRCIYSVVAADHDLAGSWLWLRRLVSETNVGLDERRAAAGGIATSLAHLPRSRAEARELLGLLAHDRVTGPAPDFEESWAALTISRATRDLDIDDVRGPAWVLQAHDATHRTDYICTLSAWLSHPAEPRLAARMLHVHPNTLRHRMHRIGELVDIDLTDQRERLALQLQVEVVQGMCGQVTPG